MEDFAGLTEVVADPVVPKGTFASEAPEPLPAPAPRPEVVSDGRGSSPPREASEPLASRSPAASTSQRILSPRAHQRPPFLASESLREDLSPLEPAPRTLTNALLGAGATGVVVNALVAFDDVAGWLCAALCSVLIVLARLRLGYAVRAQLAAGVAGIGLGAVVMARLAAGAPRSEALLALACALLPAALLFRTWYRSARLARILVAGALSLAFLWCALTSHRGLLALEFSWQSWLPALAWYVFGMLCLLSLLAFMGDETTGGCHAWAAGIATWFALYTGLRWALEHTTAGAGSMLSSARGAAFGLSEAALAGAFAVALAQVCARIFVTRSRVILRAS
jgi:hypothetical protein